MMELELVKTAWLAFFMLIAAYSDVKTRLIDDEVWVLASTLSLPIALYQLLMAPALVRILYALSALTAVLVAVALNRAKMLGGADVGALIVIGLAEVPRIGEVFPPSLSVIFNAALLSISYALFILARNVARIARGEDLFEGVHASQLTRILALITAMKVSVEELEKAPLKFSIAERLVDGRRELRLSPLIGEEEQPPEWVKGLGEVWVTPYVPMVAYIAAGWMVYKALGCLAEPLLAALLGIHI